MIHVRLGYRVISAFDIAVIRGEVKRREIGPIGLVDIRSLLNQKLSELIVPVVRGDKKRRPTGVRGLIDVCTSRDQQPGGFDIVFACGQDQGSKPASAAAHKARHRSVVLGVIIGRVSLRRFCRRSGAAIPRSPIATAPRAGGRAAATKTRGVGATYTTSHGVSAVVRTGAF